MGNAVSRAVFFPLIGLVILGLIALGTVQIVSSFHGADAGSKGAIGPQGPAGPQGATGKTGEPGPSGAPAEPGATGPRGAKGAAAPTKPSVNGGTYYLNKADLAASFIELPTSDVSAGSTTISSRELAGLAPIYSGSTQVGTFSGSYLAMQNADGIFADVTGSLSTNQGLVVSWMSPTTMPDLTLDSFIDSTVGAKTVTVTTRAGSASFFGDTFDLVVTSDSSKVYFAFDPA